MIAAAPTRSLTGPQKSAILCMALGNQFAGKLLQALSQEELEQVTREIALTQTIKSDVVDAVLHEFREVGRAVESVARGGVDVARSILEHALGPQKAKVVLDRIHEQLEETGLTRLRKAAPEVLNSLLRAEHPQTIALIIAHLDPRQAAGLLEVMEGDLASEVLYRMARMEKVSPEMLQLIEAGLGGRADLSISEEMTLSGGAAAVAKLLNITPGGLEKTLMEKIGARNQEIYDQIRRYMFVFEDLRLLDNRSMQRLLRDVESKELALSMKAASDELKQHILTNMSERAASALQEEIEFLGPVRVRDVEAAHGRIIDVVRQLEEAGEVVVSGRESDDDIIA